MKSTKIIFFALWMCMIALVIVGFRMSGVTLQEFPEFLRSWIASFGIWGPLVYISLYAVRTLTFFSASVFTIVSGLIFGPFWGIVYTVVGENLAANLAFLVGRYFGHDITERAQKQLKFFPSPEKIRENGFITVLMMRLLFFPFDWVGYLSGAAGMRQRDFALATAVGIMPGLIAFVAIGNVFMDPIRSLMIFVPFFVLGLVIARVLRTRTQLGRELHDLQQSSKETA